MDSSGRGMGACGQPLAPTLSNLSPLPPQCMWSSTQILLLILHSAALAIALFCFGYGLRHLCCTCWVGQWKGAGLLAPVIMGGLGTLEGRAPSPESHRGRGREGCTRLGSLAVVTPDTPEKVTLHCSAA